MNNHHTICINCGREVVHKDVYISLVGVNLKAKCCDVPYLFWITGGHFSKNSLHKQHVENTRRKVDGN